MAVVQYEIVDPPAVDSPEARYQFAPRGRVHALAGASGALIPPFEYHTLANALPDQVSVTLHVYGGEMSSCCMFEPLADGAYRRVEKQLILHD